MSEHGDGVRAQAAGRVHETVEAVRRALETLRPQLNGADGPWQQWLRHTTEPVLAPQQRDVRVFVEGINARLLCSIVSVIDTGDAVATLLRGGIRTQLSALVVARTALESAANVHHALTEVGRDSAEFTARSLEMAWESWSAERALHPMGSEVGMLAPGHGTRAKASLAAASLALGWRPKFSKDGNFDRLVRPGDVAGRTRPAPATARIRAACEQDGIHAWRITSGAAHGMPWMQVHEILSPDDPLPGAAAMTAAACHLEAARVLLDALGSAFNEPHLRDEAAQAQLRKFPRAIGERAAAETGLPTTDVT